MRTEPTSRFRASAYRLLGSALVALTCAGCSLRPGCGNLAAKASIESGARSSVELWLKSIGQSDMASNLTFRLVGTFETSRSGDTRSCSGSIDVQIDKDKVTVPIEYEVIGTNDGSVMYRWDGASFGKDFITKVLQLAAANAIAPPEAAETATPLPEQAPAPKSESNRADVQEAAMNQWHNEVTTEINAQASNFEIESSGTVSVAFNVSAVGEISNIKVTRSSGIARLDATAVKMVEKVGHVRQPPNQKTTSFAMKLSFI